MFAVGIECSCPTIDGNVRVDEMRATGHYGWWNERMMSDAGFVNNIKHCVKASILAMRAILDLRPDAIFIYSESTEYVHPGSPDMVSHALFMNERRFLSLDLLFGHDVSAT